MIPLIVYGLATWRIASMIVAELGPGNIFYRIRTWAGIRHDEFKKVAIVPDGFFSEVFSCVWCCSVWIGGFWMIFDLLSPWWALRLATAFAFSTTAIVIQNYIDKR